MKFFFNRNKNGNTAEEVMEMPVRPEGRTIDADKEKAVAIALAIHMYMEEMRVYENTAITMQKIMKPYSPWSSKIYGLRQQPLRIPGLQISRK